MIQSQMKNRILSVTGSVTQHEHITDADQIKPSAKDKLMPTNFKKWSTHYDDDDDN